jgi:hypothetical protein
MMLQLVVSAMLAVAGVACLVAAVVHERMMQRHRKPGVSYADATVRRDGGWKRNDLFTPAGLGHQRRASAFGVAGALLLLVSVAVWAVLGTR